MKIEDLKKNFSNQLAEIYSVSEISELFAIFMEEKLQLSKIEIRNKLKENLSEKDSVYFTGILEQLKNEIPYQYILGKSRFFGLDFKVSHAVLIPRPETEELLELAIGKIQEIRAKNQDKKHENFKILDIGTGSGVISIILKKYFPHAEISAIDFSKEALEIAKENAQNHSAKINFIFADYLTENLSDIYDVIISNPPYIGKNEEFEIDNSVKNIEPKMALFSPTSDPLIFYKKIAKDAKSFLKENGEIFLEINQKLGKETLDLFKGFSHSELIKDISGNDRFIFARK